MLSLALWGLIHASSPAIVATHGDRVEWVFTSPVTVTGHVSRYHAIRAKLSADDSGGTIYLDGGPSVYDIQAMEERPCEWVGPRLDGTDVRVCAGSVVAVRLGSDVRVTR